MTILFLLSAHSLVSALLFFGSSSRLKKRSKIHERKKKKKKSKHMPSLRAARELVSALVSSDRSVATMESENDDDEEDEKHKRSLESRVVEPLIEAYEKRETERFLRRDGGRSRGEREEETEEEEKEKEEVDERGSENDERREDEKMRQLFAHGVSDAREYALKSAVEEEKDSKEETFDEKSAKNRRQSKEQISIVRFDGEGEGETEISVVAKVEHQRFKEYVTVHDPYLRDDSLVLSYVDLANEKRVDVYAFDRADSFGSFRKTRVTFFSVECKENVDVDEVDGKDEEEGRRKKDDGDDGETISFTIRKIEETFRNCGIEEEDGGYGRDMQIERATFDSRTNAAVFEFLPKGTSLFGETKTWRKSEKKEEDCTNAGATNEDEDKKDEEDEENTEFIRKRLPFFAASFDEFGERADREAYSSARKALEDFFSTDVISKKRENRRSDQAANNAGVSKSSSTVDSRYSENEILTEIEQEALRLELEVASQNIAENCHAVLARVDCNKRHFLCHVLKERAESALKSMQRAKLLHENTKAEEEEAQRQAVLDSTRRTSAKNVDHGGASSNVGSQQLADLATALRKARVNFIACQRRYERAMKFLRADEEKSEHQITRLSASRIKMES